MFPRVGKSILDSYSLDHLVIADMGKMIYISDWTETGDPVKITVKKGHSFKPSLIASYSSLQLTGRAAARILELTLSSDCLGRVSILKETDK